MTAADDAGLPRSHFLLALAVVFVWGTNFVVIRTGLNAMPPLLFAALRFTLVALPGVFLVKKPAASWAALAAFGLFTGVGQFGLLFIAMRRDISPGLASLVMQSQVFFTVAMTALLMRERVRGFQIAAILLAGSGLLVIALNGGHAATPIGLALTLLAALSWAGGNLVVKTIGRVSMLGVVVWSSLFAAPPLIALSLALDGWRVDLDAIGHAGAISWAAILWQSAANTMFGFGAWAWLLARHPAATVTPMALLVPIFGMSASALLLGEPLQSWKLGAAALVLSGLALNLAWPRLARVLART